MWIDAHKTPPEPVVGTYILVWDTYEAEPVAAEIVAWGGGEYAWKATDQRYRENESYVTFRYWMPIPPKPEETA